MPTDEHRCEEYGHVFDRLEPMAGQAGRSGDNPVLHQDGAQELNMRRMLIGWLLMLMASVGSAFAAEDLILIRPSDGETIHDNSGEVVVVVSGGEEAAGFQAYVDGAPVGGVQPGPAFRLEGIERGEHRLSVAAVDDRGRPLAETGSITFYMWQASRLFPGGRGRGM